MRFDGMAFCMPSVMASSFSNLSYSYWIEINKVLLCFLSMWDLESWRRRALCLGEELSLLLQPMLQMRRKLHINEQVEWNMTGKPSNFSLSLMIITLIIQNVACCENEILQAPWRLFGVTVHDFWPDLMRMIQETARNFWRTATVNCSIF